MKRWIVPAVPFALSLCLSAATVGSHPFWQDSGTYLTAIQELGVLYPPGFVLYEVLCKAWTSLLFFVDFTLAVHLFSSVCAAGACALMALAVRDFLRSRGPVFKVLEVDPGPLADECGLLCGILLAGGFTFWAVAIYAKVYAFYYLILCALLWRLIRADDSGRSRDFTIAAAFIGLAWQAHPSAALAGISLLLFVWAHRGRLGWKGIAGRVLVAAACALGPSILLLPILMSRDPWLVFNHPSTVGEFARFITGGRYVAQHGAFGIDGSRVASLFRFCWEDFLGIGLILLFAGAIALGKANRKLLVGILAWVVPFAAITVLSKFEQQYDCWFVAARMPLFLIIGLGAYGLLGKGRAQGAWILRAAGAGSLVWAVAVNHRDIDQRQYVAAELYGRSILDRADPNAVLLLSGDESNGLVSYLQRVRGLRPNVILVTTSFLNSEASTGSPWYDETLIRRNPSLKRPDYAALRARFPEIDAKKLAAAAFINSNVDGPHPILSEVVVPPALLRPNLAVVPAGVFVKIIPPGKPAELDVRYWQFPIEPEQVRPLYRRVRGQEVFHEAAGIRVLPIAYERRLATLILRARFRLALARFEAKNYPDAARLCQSIIDFDDEEFESNPEIVHLLGISYYASGQRERAVPALKRSSEIGVRPETKATALYYLGEIARSRGDEAAARQYREQALAVPGLDPRYLREMDAPPDRK